jgi:hypothetical protein
MNLDRRFPTGHVKEKGLIKGGSRACMHASQRVVIKRSQRVSSKRPAVDRCARLRVGARNFGPPCASQRFRSLRSVCVTTRESKANETGPRVTLRVADICTVASTTKVS